MVGTKYGRSGVPTRGLSSWRIWPTMQPQILAEQWFFFEQQSGVELFTEVWLGPKLWLQLHLDPLKTGTFEILSSKSQNFESSGFEKVGFQIPTVLQGLKVDGAYYFFTAVYKTENIRMLTCYGLVEFQNQAVITIGIKLYSEIRILLLSEYHSKSES